MTESPLRSACRLRPRSPLLKAPELKGRQVYFKDSDFDKYGYTKECPGCIARECGLPLKRHSDACRKRLTEALKEEGNPRYEAAKDRGGLEEEEEEK